MSDSMKTTLYYVCPDIPEPVGGIKQLYRHVEILNRHGYQAFILHKKQGFSVQYFEHTAKIAYNEKIFEQLEGTAKEPMTEELFIKAGDVLVIPEVYGLRIAEAAKGRLKVIFNQNVHYTFLGYPVDLNTPEPSYKNRDVAATLVISEHSLDSMNYVFPEQCVRRLYNGINESVFNYGEKKKPKIAFMTRKIPAEVQQVINLLKYREAAQDFDLVIINGMHEREVADALKESLIFLSFSHQEGCPLPPLEAMACGCVVVGYAGFGGREYFKSEFCYPVPDGDVMAFVKTIERVLEDYKRDPAEFYRKGRQASEFVLKEYSLRREAEELLKFWQEFGLRHHLSLQ